MVSKFGISFSKGLIFRWTTSNSRGVEMVVCLKNMLGGFLTRMKHFHKDLRVYTNLFETPKNKLDGGFRYFLFSHLFGEMIQFDEHIFQMGWFNHQLDKGSCFVILFVIFRWGRSLQVPVPDFLDFGRSGGFFSKEKHVDTWIKLHKRWLCANMYQLLHIHVICTDIYIYMYMCIYRFTAGYIYCIYIGTSANDVIFREVLGTSCDRHYQSGTQICCSSFEKEIEHLFDFYSWSFLLFWNCLTYEFRRCSVVSPAFSMLPSHFQRTWSLESSEFPLSARTRGGQSWNMEGAFNADPNRR